MPTPSEPRLKGEWTARTDTPRRSVFGNYRSERPTSEDPAVDEHTFSRAVPESCAARPDLAEQAVARAFIYRLLAKAYEDPTREGWEWLCHAETQQSLRAAMRSVELVGLPPLMIVSDAFESFHAAYLAAFGHAARGSCPLNEIEYGDIKADPLFQPHRLADLAAFYRAFGLEVTEDGGERHDHICLEFEFMCVLAAKEAYALGQGHDARRLEQCRDAQKKFLREHLGRWTPAFARRLVAATTDPALQALAQFTRAFVEAECVRFGVNTGSEDLLLRPVDDAAESMCGSCGISNVPPGA
jgi:DMSO reductase family type II enzyme chaperone